MGFVEGDFVNVKHCKSGYQGPGVLIMKAFRNTWLVRIEVDEGVSVVTVKSQNLEKLSDLSNKKKKRLLQVFNKE